MGVPTSEVGYTPAMPRREDHEVHKGHVGALGWGEVIYQKISMNPEVHEDNAQQFSFYHA